MSKREELARSARKHSVDPNYIEGYVLGGEIARTKFPQRLLEWAETLEKPVIVTIGRDAIPLMKTLFLERRMAKSNVPILFYGISGENKEIRAIKKAVEEYRGTRLEGLVYEYGKLVPATAGRKRCRKIKETKDDLLWELHEIENSARIDASRALARVLEAQVRRAGARNVILVDWAHIGTHPIILSLGLRKLGWPITRIHTAMALVREPANRIHEVVGKVIAERDKEALQAANISEFTPKIMGPFVEPNVPKEIRKENEQRWREFVRGVKRGYLEWRRSTSKPRLRRSTRS